MNKARRSRSFGSSAELESLESRTLLAADLVADSAGVFPTADLSPGELVRLTARFSNQGDMTAAPFRIEFVLSTNDTFGDGDDISLGTVRRFRPLDAGDSGSRSRRFALPNDLSPGDYVVGFRLDSGDFVDESNEGNNDLVDDGAVLSVGGEAADIEISGNDAVIRDGDFTPRRFDGTSFGLAAVDDETVEHTFTITNEGGDDLNIDSIEIVGRNAGSFEVTSQPDDSLAPGESTTLVVSFDPDSAGYKRAVVRVNSNDPDEGAYTFSVAGRGVAPEPEITVSALGPISDGDHVASFNDGTHLGVVTVGGFAEQTFTITNSGNADLILTSPFVTLTGRQRGRFEVVDQPDITTLAPGESTTFTIRFNATTPGTKKATVNIFSNDLDEAVFDFQVRGRGHP